MPHTSRDRYLTFLTKPDAADILDRARRTESYYPDALAADVLRNKYLAPGEEGPLDLWERVARALAGVEADSGIPPYNTLNFRRYSARRTRKVSPGARTHEETLCAGLSRPR